MSAERVTEENDSELPESIFDIRFFVCFVNFYRLFIKSFFKIVKLLTTLVDNGVKISWMEECQRAFDKLKVEFTTVPILTQFNWDKKILVKTNVSDLTSVGVPVQYDGKGIMSPVAFDSKNISPMGENYKNHDKE